MAAVYDGRTKTGAGGLNKRRFLERVKDIARRAIYDSIENKGFTDIGDGGLDVIVGRDSIKEPSFHHGRGGLNHRVLPHNKNYSAGDQIPRPRNGGNGGSGGGSSGEGEDDFVFHLSQQEFLDILFEDLGLPNMSKKNLVESKEFERHQAGMSTSGNMSQMERKRSLRRRKGRLMAAELGYNQQILDLLTEARDIMLPYNPSLERISPLKEVFGIDTWKPISQKCRDLDEVIQELIKSTWRTLSYNKQIRIKEIEAEVEVLIGKRSLIPRWNQATDLRFRHYPPRPLPENKAVMFCVMDVSGSMDEEKKTCAKIFYFLLYNFLKKNHDTVEVVFVRHHTEAEEVTEHEFFYGTESGGTIVSSALRLVDEIVKERYMGKNFDIYMAQTSDGDNSSRDNEVCDELMRGILGYTAAVFYTEITQGDHQELWDTYEEISQEYSDSFWMGQVKERSDIWPLFRGFFARKYEFNTVNSLKPFSALTCER